MAGNIKVGGHTVFTHTGPSGAGTLSVQGQNGNVLLSDNGTAVSLGNNVRLPTSGGIKDSSGNNILTESGGVVSIANASVGIRKVTSAVNSSNAYNSGELVSIVDGSGNPTGQVFVHDGSTNGGSLVNKTLLRYWTNSSARNAGSHADNINLAFNIDQLDLDITPSAGATYIQIKCSSEVRFFQGWGGGGWGGTGTTARIEIDNVTVQSKELSSAGYAGHYMGTTAFRTYEHIYDCTNGNAFNVKFHIPSNSTAVGSTWAIHEISYEIFEWGGSWDSDSTLYIRPGV